jgi:hypothetical protein
MTVIINLTPHAITIAETAHPENGPLREACDLYGEWFDAENHLAVSAGRRIAELRKLCEP